MSHYGRRRFDDVIVSSANPLIKNVRSLQRRKARYQERAFVVEGVRAVSDAMAAGATVRTFLLQEGVHADEIVRALDADVVRTVSEDVFRTVSDVEYPQGVLAVVAMPDAVDLTSRVGQSSLVVVADGVRDPGNLGTLLRSSAAAGVDVVIMAEESVDPYNPKTVRAAMGAHFHVSIAAGPAEEVETALQHLDQVIVADASGDAVYDDVDLTVRTGIVVGGEAFGPLSQFSHRSLRTVRIPMSGGVESLNAGVAGSLLVFEAARQRRRRR